MNKYLEHKLRKRSRKRKASEGMTAAIILIAFIITAAGIAFVILTMGSEMQLELGDVGSEGREAASSAMQVEGGKVSAWVAGGTVDAYAFNLKLVLGTGQVDLSSDAITIWLQVGTGEEEERTYTAGDATLALTANTANASKYFVNWYDGTGDVLDPDEMARIYIGGEGDPASESDDIVIIINSGVATLKIEKTIPVGLVTGHNYI